MKAYEYCDMCGKWLRRRRRYKVRIVEPEFNIQIKKMVVCEQCLRRLKKLRPKYKVYYRKMRTLE